MKTSIYIIHICILLMFVTRVYAGNGNERASVKVGMFGLGVRWLHTPSLNDALMRQGLACLGEVAYTPHVGVRYGCGRNMVEMSVVGLVVNNKENLTTSSLTAWGFSFGYGYQIWKTRRMAVYPFLEASWLFPRFRTQEETGATSFDAVYGRPTAERTFYNAGEMDAALGVAYRLKVGGKGNALDFRGGYNLRLFQGSWRYAGKKTDFPGTDLRGWEVGIAWIYDLL